MAGGQLSRDDICRELFHMSDGDRDGIIWRRDLDRVCRELDLGFTAEAIIPHHHRGRVSFLQFQKYFSSLPDTLLYNDTSTSSYESLKRNDHSVRDPSQATDFPETKEEYEERIIELHCVIAELTRKMEEGKQGVIKEELTEDIEDSLTTDSFADEAEAANERIEAEEFDDYTSLAFERDLEENSRSYRRKQMELLAKEKHELEEKLKLRDNELLFMKQERDTYKRQISDLMTTCEYQEARMEAEGTSLVGRPPWERRSLRKKKSDKMKDKKKAEDDNSTSCVSPVNTIPGSPSHAPSATRSIPSGRLMTGPSSGPALSGRVLPGPATSSSSPYRRSNSQPTADKDRDFIQKCMEFELEIEKINSHVDHLKTQNKVLNLALEESKSTCDSLTELLGKYESNNTALQLSLSYCDTIIETYDVLVALLETSTEELTSRDLHNNSINQSMNEKTGGNRRNASEAGNQSHLHQRQSNRARAERVARHLLSRASSVASETSPAPTNNSNNHHNMDSTWEESSGYSHTASSSSTTSSGLHESHQVQNHHSSQPHEGNEEMRLKEYISQLKVGRASIQATVLELESIHCDTHPSRHDGLESRHRPSQEEMDLAVLLQELAAMREERADLRAQLYLIEREKGGLELDLDTEKEKQRVLQVQLEQQRNEGVPSHYQQSQLNSQYRKGRVLDERETEQQLRVHSLLASLEKISRNSDLRQKQSMELIEDLKRANGMLSGALEQTKRKYQARIRKLEQNLSGKPTDTVASSTSQGSTSTKG